MLNKTCIGLLVLCFQLTLYSQHTNHHFKSKKNYDNLNEVYDEIISTQMSDREKVDAIFKFVTYNVAYDCKKLKRIQKIDQKNRKYKSKSKSKRKVYPQQSLLETINKGKGVCSDYSALFAELCNRADIKNKIVSGYAKNSKEEIGKRFKANHAWNYVELNDSIYFIDATWSSGGTDENCSKFFHHPDSSYYLIPMEYFRHTHFSNAPTKDSTYLAQKQYYFDMPYINSGAYEIELKDFYPKKGLIKMKLDSTQTFELRANQKLNDLTIKSDKGNSNTINFKDEDTVYKTEFKPNKTGKQFVFIYANGKLIAIYKVYVRG